MNKEKGCRKAALKLSALQEGLPVDRLWIADDDESKILHVGVRDPLNIFRLDGPDTIEEFVRISPSSAVKLVPRELPDLGGARFLIQVILTRNPPANSEMIRADLMRKSLSGRHHSHALLASVEETESCGFAATY